LFWSIPAPFVLLTSCERLGTGVRWSLGPRERRRPRARGQPRVRVRQRSRPGRSRDAPVEHAGRCLPEGLGEDDAAVRAPRKDAARVVDGAVQAGTFAGLPGGSPDRAVRPGEAVGPARGAGGLSPPAEDADARRLGSRDRVFPNSQGREAPARLRRGSFELVPDCGHMPHVECPDRFLGALDGFLLKRVQR
jgi:pimeloyl-ACP methyl ester carboxylesterase